MISLEEAIKRDHSLRDQYHETIRGSREEEDAWEAWEANNKVIRFYNADPTQQLCIVAKEIAETPNDTD